MTGVTNTFPPGHTSVTVSETGHTSVTVSETGQVKERLRYVAPDYEAELAKDPATTQRDYELPDGQVFTIGQERFQCPEVLFRPSLLGRTGFQGIHRYVWTSITRCDLSVRREMLENVVLAGGCARFPGIAERFRNEIQALAQEAGDSDGSLRARVRQTWLLYTHTLRCVTQSRGRSKFMVDSLMLWRCRCTDRCRAAKLCVVWRVHACP
jgi:hypothetical protein